MDKKHRNAVKQFLCIACLLVIGVSFLFESFCNFRILNNSNNNAVLQYKGQYVYSEETYLRNVNYKFVLENGHILTIPCEHVVSTDFENYSTLTFTYTANKSLFSLGKHRVLTIRSNDDQRVFVEEDTTIRETRIGTITYMIIGVSCLLILILPLLFSALLILIDKTRSSAKKRKR